MCSIPPDLWKSVTDYEKNNEASNDRPVEISAHASKLEAFFHQHQIHTMVFVPIQLDAQ
jgi:hypothetical protein